MGARLPNHTRTCESPQKFSKSACTQSPPSNHAGFLFFCPTMGQKHPSSLVKISHENCSLEPGLRISKLQVVQLLVRTVYLSSFHFQISSDCLLQGVKGRHEGSHVSACLVGMGTAGQHSRGLLSQCYKCLSGDGGAAAQVATK